MKQILFLLLLPCLAMAQYPGNGNQKITLGEQTSADGLVYRGLAADTTRKPSVDTMAFILLDTNTNIIWQYKKATNNAWTRVGGSISSGITGVLPVANGGTGTGTEFTQGSVVFAGASGTYTQDNSNLFLDDSNNRLGIGTVSPAYKLDVNGVGRFNNDLRIETVTTDAQLIFKNNASSNPRAIAYNVADGSITINRTGGGSSATFFNTGAVRIPNLANAANPVNVQVDVNGTLVRTSSIDIKEDVQNLPYGLNEIMLLQPSKFSYIDKYKYGEGYDIGFIAQDVNDVIPEAVGTGIDSDIFMDSVKLIPILTKAIQEQQALIKTLEQRLLILENK